MDSLTILQKGFEEKLDQVADKFIASLNTFLGELMDNEFDLDNFIEFPLSKDEINSDLLKKHDKMFKTAVYCFGFFQVPEIVVVKLLEMNIFLEYIQEEDQDLEGFSLTFMHSKYKKYMEDQ